MKGFADNNIESDENGRKLSKRVENTVGKGEIARMSNFSFSRSVFKRLLLQTHKNQGLFGKGLKAFFNRYIQCPGFSPEIFEGVVAFSGVVNLGSITNVTQSAT